MKVRRSSSSDHALQNEIQAMPENEQVIRELAGT